MNNQQQRMVVGFMFSPDKQLVALIRKINPVWQRGLLNGVGGKVEPGESSLDAMCREFHEETGVPTGRDQWEHRGIMHGPDWLVNVFSCVSDEVYNVRSTTAEIVSTYNVHRLGEEKIVENLIWLVHAALDKNFVDFSFTYKHSK